MIELLNRRFVPFFFNRGGPGMGRDDAASAFVAGQTENPYAYFAAFTPQGKYLGETDLYADKDEVFEFLATLLRQHPDYAKTTEAEERALDGGGLESARLLTELGRYDQALASFTRLIDDAPVDETSLEARVQRLQVTRYLGDWEEHRRFEDELHAALDAAPSGRRGLFEADLAVEGGRRAIAEGRYRVARDILQAAAATHSESRRGSEAHFYAGVACWMDGDRDWAKFHFMWVVRNLPDDRLYSRARIAAAAEAMPYANPELGGFAADVGDIGTESIVLAVAAAAEVYQQLLPRWDAGDYHAAPGGPAPPAAPAPADASPTLLVAGLRDGNEHRVANNRIVDQLSAIGARAVPSLVAAIEDRRFPGRGYAAWALSQVLSASDARDEPAIQALEDAARDEDPYVSALARSGLEALR